MKLHCTTCKNTIDSFNAMTCAGCGSLQCSNCADATGHMCQNCYGGLNFYH